MDVVHLDYVYPEKPMNLAAKALSENIINLSWVGSNDRDIEGYRIYKNDTGGDSDGPFRLQNNVTSNTTFYLFNDLLENTTYYFLVSVFDEANNVMFSDVAMNTTIAVPPATPTLETLPSYYNKLYLNVTGTSDPNTRVFIYQNGMQVAWKNTSATGTFLIQIKLFDGVNQIKVIARDLANIYSGFSLAQTVILDVTPPMAITGDDVYIFINETVTFDASLSSDSNGIVNYTWSFKLTGDDQVFLYGNITSFYFNITGDFHVTLTVTDVAGNSATDTLLVNVTIIPKRPIIKWSEPVSNSLNVSVKIAVTFTFSLPMNTSSVENVLIISPFINYEMIWSDRNRILTIVFTKDLNYESDYTITIGESSKAKTGGLLENAPFVLKFKTGAKELPMSITIISPAENTKVESDSILTVSGTSFKMAEGINVTVTLSGATEITQIGADGTWSVEIQTPHAAGNYTIRVSAEGKSISGLVIVTEKEKPDEPEDKDEDKGLLGLGPNADYAIILLIVIIIIIIILILVLRKRKGPKEPTPKEEVGEEPEKGPEIEAEVSEEMEEEEEVEVKEEPKQPEVAEAEVEEPMVEEEPIVEEEPFGEKEPVVEEEVETPPPVPEKVEEAPPEKVEEVEEPPAADAEEAKGTEKEVETELEESVAYTCPECNSAITPSMDKCSGCGAILEWPEELKSESGSEPTSVPEYECPECGSGIHAGASVCPGCGVELDFDIDS